MELGLSLSPRIQFCASVNFSEPSPCSVKGALVRLKSLRDAQRHVPSGLLLFPFLPSLVIFFFFFFSLFFLFYGI